MQEENTFSGGNLKERGHLETLGIEGKIILKEFLNKIGRRGMDLSGLCYGQVACSCAHGKEYSGTRNAENFLTRWGTVSFSRQTLLQGFVYHCI
jgi:hypothetical protein